MKTINIGVFGKSKYFSLAKAKANDVCPPLSYQFFIEDDPNSKASGRPLLSNHPKSGIPIVKSVSQKPVVRLISRPKTQNRRIQQYLAVSSQEHRKTYCISASSEQFVNHQLTHGGILQATSKCYAPHSKSTDVAVVDWISALLGMAENDQFRYIRDYSLSSYIVYAGLQAPYAAFLEVLLQEQHLPYSLVTIHSHSTSNDTPELQRNGSPFNQWLKIPAPCPTLRSAGYVPDVPLKDIEALDLHISAVKQAGLKSDPMFNGVHLYIDDIYRHCATTGPLLAREEHAWPAMQSTLYMLSGVLADGQTAVLRLGGIYGYKTHQYLFILKLMFGGKINLIRPACCNPLADSKFIVCKQFEKSSGDLIHEYLRSNYHYLWTHGQSRLLLNPATIYRGTFQLDLSYFNDSALKTVKQIAAAYKQSGNLSIYPTKKSLLRLIELAAKFGPIHQQLKSLAETIPDEEEKVTALTPPPPEETIEKTATVTLDFLTNLSSVKPAAPSQPKAKAKAKAVSDESNYESYLKRVESTQKAQNQAKKAQKKEKEKVKGATRKQFDDLLG